MAIYRVFDNACVSLLIKEAGFDCEGFFAKEGFLCLYQGIEIVVGKWKILSILPNYTTKSSLDQIAFTKLEKVLSDLPKSTVPSLLSAQHERSCEIVNKQK